MFARFSGNDRKIVAGIKLPVDTSFVKSVLNLARRTEMSVSFVHVVEPMYLAGSTYPGEYVSINIAKMAEVQRIEDANIQLKKVMEEFQEDYSFETKVLVGNPSEAIRSESFAMQASLVVAGVKAVSRRFVPKGFSTAVGLMAESSIPVLTIPEGNTFAFDSSRLTLLVADDLTPTSADVVPTVAELAGTLKNSELIHFHSHPETKGRLKRWAEQISNIMAINEFEYDFSINHDSIVEDTEKQISKQLKARVEVPISYLEKNDVAYIQRITFGDVAEELSGTIKSTNPDFIAFGRHHFLHKQPFAIGKVPFYSMLEFEKPVLLVSNIARLS